MGRGLGVFIVYTFKGILWSLVFMRAGVLMGLIFAKYALDNIFSSSSSRRHIIWKFGFMDDIGCVLLLALLKGGLKERDWIGRCLL